MIVSKQGAAAFVACFLASSAFANDILPEAPSPADIAVVENCLSRSKSRRDRFTCIGFISGNCRETQDGATTMGATMCYTREHIIWDKLLNKTHRDLMSEMTDDLKKYIRSTQLVWIKYRDRSCLWAYSVYPGGSIARQISAECVMTQTALRTFDLLDIKLRDK